MASALVGFAVHVDGHSVSGVFGGFALAAVLILVLSFARIFPTLKGGTGDKGMYLFAAQVLLSQLVFQAVFRQDVLLLQPLATDSFVATGLDPAAAAEKAHELLGHWGLAAFIARLPWQATLAITFVIFPMLSESTFAQDAERTRAYIRQTVRYSLLLIGGAAIALTAVAEPLVRGVWPPAYAPTAVALAWLAPAYAAFAIFNILMTMLTAAGRATAVLGINLLTAGVAYVAYQSLLTGVGDSGALLVRAGLATAIPFTVGLCAAAAVLWRAYGRPFPVPTVLRVLGLGAVLVPLGWALPLPETLVSRLAPNGGALARLLGVGYAGGCAVLMLVLFGMGVVLTRELGAEDKARFARVLRRKKA